MISDTSPGLTSSLSDVAVMHEQVDTSLLMFKTLSPTFSNRNMNVFGGSSSFMTSARICLVRNLRAAESAESLGEDTLSTFSLEIIFN
jgi:hypothetical protein